MVTLLSKPLRLSARVRKSVKALLHVAAILFLAGLFYLGVTDRLGADPVDTLLHYTGIWTLISLFICLTLSPLSKHLPCGDLMRFRRMTGIYAFVFAFCHFLTYALFELQLNISLLGEEIVKRPYITVGMAALLILLALTATSTSNIRRRMGKRWQQLHNSIYLAMLLGLLHFTWSQKTFWQEPVFYWLIGLSLLILRKDKFQRLLRRRR
ncbi:sulfite oxidase heme-binding subunit YedZ [Alteromonas halophila]|uniref:Protein-methionine-sulfoxide reductase heme-binding subunit MsrQ n=1 Tax=Alteromonas halophila TaxID=516698 RepID=A0A918N0C8_9ALTE|nr:protein-methionine-sulfoxide reductase heme-binding subunit MsrQ [Alteromonas halophila]GGW89010.1 protein-methionine-sulfoxide reductase heme-binding subunit MsrQ [Alteromonas halophila]